MSNGWYAKNGYLSESETESNALLFAKYFRPRKWADTAIAGMLGNISYESGINPGIWESLDPYWRGYGLVQWTPYTKLFDWLETTYGPAKDILDGYQQCARIDWEQKNGEQWFIYPGYENYYMSWDDFKAGKRSPEYLAQVFLLMYEHPMEESIPDLLRIRAQLARKWFEFIQGKIPPGSELPPWLVGYLSQRRHNNVL